jgi:hypothetical protein
MDYIQPAPEALIIKVTLIYRLEPFHTLVTNSRYQLRGPDPTNGSVEYMGES